MPVRRRDCVYVILRDHQFLRSSQASKETEVLAPMLDESLGIPQFELSDKPGVLLGLDQYMDMENLEWWDLRIGALGEPDAE